MGKVSWHEEIVNTKKKYQKIVYGDEAIPVCLVQPEKNNNSLFGQFLIERAA